MTRIKPLNAALAAALVAGSSLISPMAGAWNAGPPKYLIVWTSDQSWAFRRELSRMPTFWR